MATLTLEYAKINSSIQVGDHVFYSGTKTNNGFIVGNEFADTQGSHQVGRVTEIGVNNNQNHTVVVNIDNSSMPIPVGNDNNNKPYFYFVKDMRVNSSGVLGYYAEVKLEDKSLTKSELFSVGAEIFESSK